MEVIAKLVMLGLACVMFYHRDKVVRWVDNNIFADTDAKCWLCGHSNRISSALHYFECERCEIENLLHKGRGYAPPIK